MVIVFFFDNFEIVEWYFRQKFVSVGVKDVAVGRKVAMFCNQKRYGLAVRKCMKELEIYAIEVGRGILPTGEE